MSFLHRSCDLWAGVGAMPWIERNAQPVRCSWRPVQRHRNLVMEGEQSKNANQGHPLDGRWTQQGHGQGSVELAAELPDRYRSISGL